jgi:glycosyltransferase involved in cell wall biosynthesis
MAPKISVVLPVYNAELYLEEAIASILNQTFNDFELLIINDASSDGSSGIIERMARQDSRIRVLHNPENLRLIGTLNRALDNVSGEYIARMDSDDISEPGRLMAQYDYFKANPNCVLTACEFIQFGQNGALPRLFPLVQSDSGIRAMMLLYSAFLGPSVMMRRRVILKHNLRYDPAMIHAEDFAFYRALGEYGSMANLPASLYRYRLHGESVSVQNLELQEETATRIAYEAISQAGLKPYCSLEDVALVRCHHFKMRSFTLAQRLRQASVARRLIKHAARVYKVSREEADLVLKIWLSKCKRSVNPDPKPVAAVHRTVLNMASAF